MATPHGSVHRREFKYIPLNWYKAQGLVWRIRHRRDSEFRILESRFFRFKILCLRVRIVDCGFLD